MDDRIAAVPFDRLHGIRWSDSTGGAISVQRRAGRQMIIVHFDCTDIVEGEVAHSCTHGPPPHRIRACVVKKDNPKATYDRLLEIVGPKPPKPMTNAEFRELKKNLLSGDSE